MLADNGEQEQLNVMALLLGRETCLMTFVEKGETVVLIESVVIGKSVFSFRVMADRSIKSYSISSVQIMYSL